MNTIKDQCAIAGIGQTDFMVNSGRDRVAMTLEAITKAVQDAGLTVNDIDGIVRYAIDASASDQIIASNLGLSKVRYSAELPHQGGSSCATVAQAAMAVASGMTNCVVCYRTFTPFDFDEGGRHSSETLWAKYTGAGQFLRPFGWSEMIVTCAMALRRHMNEYGTTSRQLGAIAVAARKHAAMNPKAIRRQPITIEDHQNSPYVTAPLRLLDCMIAPNDGSCAVVVTSSERAKDLRQRPAYIMAVGQGFAPRTPARWEFWPFRETITENPAKYLGPRLFEMAGIKPKDIDVAQIYDCWTYSVLSQLEDYGFCKKGEGGAFVEGGHIELGGDLPINTHGGHLGEAYIHGFNHILEGVRQVRGTSTAQVKEVQFVLVTAAPFVPTSALILRR